MCELLGMSANVPTDICFSFTGLVQRGGRGRIKTAGALPSMKVKAVAHSGSPAELSVADRETGSGLPH